MIRTISQIVDDHSVEHSLDIFGETSSHNNGLNRKGDIDVDPNIPKWAVIEDNMQQAQETSDGFEKFMRSLMKDESFHNSLNNWMGSLSDVFDENKQAVGRELSDEDHQAMDTNIRHMRDLGQYLRRSLSCRNLLPLSDDNNNDADLGRCSNRRRHFRRSQSFRDLNKPPLSDVAECDYEEGIKISTSPFDVFDRDSAPKMPLGNRVGYDGEDEVSSIMSDTEVASFCDDLDPAAATPGGIPISSI